MPKRKRSDDTNHIRKKIKKLDRKLKRSRKNSDTTQDSSSSMEKDHISVERILDSPFAQVEDINDSLESIQVLNTNVNAPTAGKSSAPEIDTNISLEPVDVENSNANENTESGDFDPEILEILGIDPSVTTKYGKDIHIDLATRLEHIATAGLSKETRKELNERYLIPANCTKIDAPGMNAEIKAAVTEVVLKRDKGIEMRQKQLAAAISGLSTVLSAELQSKHKDNIRLKQLMDICRILCDIQHSESVTRRNFAIFSIKKELKEYLTDSKIDKYLFGEDLAETLKAAKAVSKSGSELKTKMPPKPKQQTPINRTLNWKGQGPARRPQGPARGRESAPTATATTATTRFSRNVPPASSSRTSQPPTRQTRRR